MKSFEQITCVDITHLTDEALQQLAQFSHNPLKHFDSLPQTAAETLDRMQGADAILVGWNTPITGDIIARCPQLKYIGLCCSLLDAEACNVDLAAAHQQNIKVVGVKDYGDEGVVEFIFAQLIALAKGINGPQWKSHPTELKGKILGIIGLGTMGQMVAQTALAFGMQVCYYSRTRKPWLENDQLHYLELEDLLSKAHIISTHLPRNNRVLTATQFQKIAPNSILINTSLGPTYELEAFDNWIGNQENFAIIDLDGATGAEALYRNKNNILFYEKVAGMTDAAYERLSQKVIENLRAFLKV